MESDSIILRGYDAFFWSFDSAIMDVKFVKQETETSADWKCARSHPLDLNR